MNYFSGDLYQEFPEVQPGGVWLPVHQQKVDLLALSLVDHPLVKAARAQAVVHFQQSSEFAVADAPATMARAIDNMLFSCLQVGTNRDPANPGVLWTARLQYAFDGHKIPPTNHGMDNPDRGYRLIGVGAEYQYEITGKRHPTHPTPLDLTFEALPPPSFYGQPMALLKLHDIDVSDEGTFRITADSTPSDGRRNHLYLPPETSNIIVRDTFSDWANSIPNQIEIRVLAGPARKPRTIDEIASECVAIFNGCVERHMGMIQYTLREQPANCLIAFERPVHWGLAGNLFAANRFELQDDEALMLTIHPLTSRYFTLATGDPWSGSVPYDVHQSCLNTTMGQANEDGTFTFVISPKDPGVYNWLDTGGLRTGSVFARWEAPSVAPLAKVGTDPKYGSTKKWAPEKSVKEAVLDARVVKVQEVAKLIPRGQSLVSPEQRKVLAKARLAASRVRMYGKVV